MRSARARGRIIGVFIVGVLIVASMYLYNYVTTANRFAIEKIELAGLSRVDRSEPRPIGGGSAQGRTSCWHRSTKWRRASRRSRASQASSRRRVLPNRVVLQHHRARAGSAGLHRPLLRDRRRRHGDARRRLHRHRSTCPPSPAWPCDDVARGTPVPGPDGARCAWKRCASAADLGAEFAGNISELRATSDQASRCARCSDDCVLAHRQRRLRAAPAEVLPAARRAGPSRRASGVIDLRFDNQVVLRSG